jgi:hypothetical protein
MNTITTFQKAASGELTPEAAVQQMFDEDRRAREARRPAWLPRSLVTAGATIAVALGALVGIRNDDR